MLSNRNIRGFAVVEIMLLLVIVLMIGAVGYKIYNTKSATDKITKDTEASLQQTPSSSSKYAAVPVKISSAGDLDKAEKALDSYGSSNDDNQDLSQLDSQLSAF